MPGEVNFQNIGMSGMSFFACSSHELLKCERHAPRLLTLIWCKLISYPRCKLISYPHLANDGSFSKLFEEHHIRRIRLKLIPTHKKSLIFQAHLFPKDTLRVSWVERPSAHHCHQGAEEIMKRDWEGGQKCSMHS